MKVFATLFLALLCGAAANAEEDAKNRPVSKVINVLKDMITQLEKEAEEDEEIYEAFACWCTTNDKEKTKSIADGEQEVQDLTAAIESFTAGSAKLVAEIGNLESEVAKNTEALESATAMRRKEKSEFNAEEKSTLQTISSLKGAVIALSKHHESFLQGGSSAAAFMRSAQDVVDLHDVIRKNKDILTEMFTPRQRKELNAFVQDMQDGQAPASGEIFGLLKQMKETFETNLANSQKEETANQRDYENLKATKDDEIKAGTAQLDKKSELLATSDEKLAQSKESLVDTQNVLAADIKFLANLKDQCGNMDAEYEERTQTRQLEIGAVTKALGFLNSDEAHDLFTRTFNFAQVFMNRKSNDQRRKQISKLLAKAAHKAKDPNLSLLSVKARMDAFGEVKASIQGMVDKLTKEKTDEIKKKGYCVEEITQNEHDIQEKTVDKNDLEAKIGDLKETIHQLNTQIEALKAEIAELQVQIKRSGENREKANKEFQITIADQRATQKLLNAALDILKGFYDKMALVQTDAKDTQAPPPKFKTYGKNAQSGGVMGMMKSIIADSANVENEAIRGEEDSQKAYEDFVKDSNESIDLKIKEVVNLSEIKAKAEKDKVEAEAQLESVLGELESLDNENADLHKECDFTLKNFDIRQTARDDEIEALKQAIAMFSGASFSAFLEFNDPSTPEESDPSAPDSDFDVPLLSSFSNPAFH
jgi:chromosome segregation ATPase